MGLPEPVTAVIDDALAFIYSWEPLVAKTVVLGTFLTRCVCVDRMSVVLALMLMLQGFVVIVVVLCYVYVVSFPVSILCPVCIGSASGRQGTRHGPGRSGGHGL